MKRGLLGIVLLAVVGLMVVVFGGCSAARIAHETGRDQAPASERTQRILTPSAHAKTGSRPNAVADLREEELWIIGRGEKSAAKVAPAEFVPGSGVLATPAPDSDKLVPVPLKHTDVKASIAGYIATVDVTQQYENPFSSKIEAVYVFPLPDNAAVSEFVMTIGPRKIRGIIRDREEAQRLYTEARNQGYVASLLTQERPNIFTQKVANIEPGKKIDVNLKYFHTLDYHDGSYEFVFPMVVGPRFNPAGTTDGIGTVAQGARGQSGQNVEIEYLRPNERSGHDISLSVAVDAGVPIEKIESINHAIQQTLAGEGKVNVRLASGDNIPNKDLVLRYQVAGKTPKAALFTHRDQRGGYFTLMLLPPKVLDDLPRQPLEMVFTLDTSGSMKGRPMEQSKAAMRWALKNMNERDTFQIVNFSDRPTKFAAGPVPATQHNLRAALDHVDRMSGNGGTMLVDGLRASLLFPQDSSRLRVVAFLTDGFIGNESQALRELHNSLGSARIFSFGVGSATNRFLMNEMARMGRGAVAYLSLNEDGAKVMQQFFDRVSHPALADVQIDWGGLDVKEVYPQRIPDLMVGRPVIITGRFYGSGETNLTIRGKAGGSERVVTMPVHLDAAPTSPALPALWARAKIAGLMERAIWEENRELPQQVKSIAMMYGLVSPYTAFLAVDASERTAGNVGTTVNVAVPVPDGVQYETTVQEGEQPKKAAVRD